MNSVTFNTTVDESRVESTRELLVLWQNPGTRRVFLVGRLAYDGDEYTFGYTKCSSEAFDTGFRGLPGLRSRDKVYRSTSLFPVFAQRTIDPTRPDYQGVLSTLGLTDPVTPIEQLINSGGRRVADTIQLLEAPRLDGQRITSTLLAHGVRWLDKRPLGFLEGDESVTSDEVERNLTELEPGAVLLTRPEPRNEKNPGALVFTTLKGGPVGYVPDALLDGVHALGDKATFTVVRVNGTDAPPHLRLVVQLSAEELRENPFDCPEWTLNGTEDHDDEQP